MGLAVWISSPAPILRVANTPRPADSVSKTRIGGGPGRPGSLSLSAVPVSVEKDVRISFVWKCNSVLDRETQRLVRAKAEVDILCVYGLTSSCSLMFDLWLKVNNQHWRQFFFLIGGDNKINAILYLYVWISFVNLIGFFFFFLREC